MKKITLLLTLVIVSVCALTSCDGDLFVSYTLEGTWEGDMYICTTYGGRDYDASYSEIEFLKDPFHYTSGSGYWYDEYSNAPWDYFCSRFDWQVQNGIIYITLIDDYDMTLTIRDYRINDDRFEGYIDYDGGSKRFSLTHTSSPNWTYYNYGWDYDYYSYAAGDTRAADRPVRHLRSSN